MASILYAWEFGANLGHVGAFMPLGRALRDHRHAVHWVVAQPAAVGDFIARNDFAWLPAPVMTEVQRQGPPLTYADILLRFGYADANALYGLVGAWRRLMQLTGAQLILADHAPTAVLAARTLGIPVMLFSNGFTVPPHRCPLPNMRPWVPLADAQLAAIDAAALASVNAVLQRFGRPALPTLATLFDVAEETMTTFPELDHYGDRGPARYWGSLPSAGGGQPVPWTRQAGPRLFAYLRPESIHHEAALAAMQGLGWQAAIYFPGMNPQLRERYRAAHMLFLDAPADIAAVSREVDVAITYSSLATTTAFLLAGKPLLLLPGHLEQFLVARRVVEMGAGLLVNPEQPPGDLQPALRQLVAEPGFRDNAAGFAAKYAAFDQSKVLDNLVRRIEELTETA